MNSALAKIFRRLIYGLLLLSAILVILFSVFLSQFDLDNYRQELETTLGKALEQPVAIGYSKLTFNKGIALRFHDLRIGSETAPLALIPYLTATLKIVPLFDGKIILDQVDIDNPSLQLRLPFLNRVERSTAHQLTDELGIRILRVHDAKLQIHRRSPEGTRELLCIDDLNLVLQGWQANRSAQLVVAGQLQQEQKPAEFLLNMVLPSSLDPAIWRNEPFNTQFSIDNLATGPLSKLTQNRAPSAVNLKISLQGIPTSGAKLKALLENASSNEQLFTLNGRWDSSVEQDALTKLTGKLFGLPMSGEFYLLRGPEQHYLAGRFSTRNITLDSELLKGWRLPGADKLVAGNLERLALILEKKWPAGEPFSGLPRVGAEFTITDLEWEQPEMHQVQNFTVEMSLENQELTIKEGLLVAAGQALSFSGQIGNLYTDPQLQLNAALDVQLEDLMPYLQLPQDWKISGAASNSLNLSGSLLRPVFALQTDFSTTELQLGPLLRKKAGQQSHLQLQGLIDQEQVQLDSLKLNLADFVINGNGCFTHDPKDRYFLLDIDPVELRQLHALSPVMKQLALHGTVHPSLERDEQGLQGTLQLAEVGMHLYNIVGDLKRTTGEIAFNHQGLNFQKLQATFGESDFILSGQLKNWQSPQLNLALKSDKVRAQDLIFSNQQLTFYDLEGQLQIDHAGIRFNPVNARLEKATEVRVTGQVAGFSNPQVTLDIAADRANIDEVINLFQGPARSRRSQKKYQGKPTKITARVKEGRIGGLTFQNAEGLITDHHGIFTLYPLQFQNGAGSCQARVEFDRNQKGGLLKVSGHAENINASVLHQDLFEERGLINGRLRGSFYLEGSLAENKFWDNVVGSIHLQVTDGTLRKFRGLARVFSLLNVSQIFAGKLPDMDKEGMPFTLMEGSFRIADGRAETEDLFITSEAMNMSLVGSKGLIDGSLNFNLGVMPLRTVDKVITSIPIAGWVLAGEDKALLTAHFKIEGNSEEPKVTPVPISSVSKTVFGIFKRTLGLPEKLVKDIGTIFKEEPEKKKEPID
ncbi:MAG: hypothetical protein GQ578_08955 [Desulfuromonadaceae bacterium]|nr:hypothetical protein [Desulfuromonadaceae bacterium]